MKKKKVLSLVLSAILCIGMPASAMASEFTSGEEENAVEFAAEDEFTDNAEAVSEIAENNGDADSYWADTIKDVLLDTQYNDTVDFMTGATDKAYKFTLDSAGLFDIVGTFSKISNITLSVYDNSRKKIADSPTFESDKVSKEGTFDYSIELTKGTYYVTISGCNLGPDGDTLIPTTGECSFMLVSSNIEETIPEEQGGSNNKLDDADEISLNKMYKGLLTYNDFVDWYKFTIPKDDASVKITTDVQDYMDGVLYKKENGKLVCVDGGTDPFEKEWELNAGEYYLRLKFLASPMAYQFKVNAHFHKWKCQSTPATLKSDGLIFYTCSCDRTKTGKTIYRPKTISLSKTKYTYDGCAHKPKVKVKDRKGKVISPSNYKVTYSKGLTKKGTYNVKITFKGKYSGSVNKTFKIV